MRAAARTTSSITESLVAVLQLTSTNDKQENLKVARDLIEKSSALGAKVVFLPECFDFVGEDKKNSLELAEPLDGPTITSYREIAAKQNVWLSLGGFHEKVSLKDSIGMHNTHILLNNHGEIVGRYCKAHLFDVAVLGGAILMESEYVIPGKEISEPIATPVGKIGLQVQCYDLRFPELSIAQTQLGADILTYPSAFTVPTGMAHWEVLLRARAIENQCYVIASAQTGRHNANRQSYGHTMVIDPWGTVIAQCQEGIGLCLANIDQDYLKQLRESMPVWKHRRNDIYNNPLKGK
eukprot:gene15717-17302_t